MGASLSPNEANLFKLIVLFCKLEQDWKFPNSHIEFVAFSLCSFFFFLFFLATMGSRNEV
ncbi:hypothetical protein GLYMA_03G131300v4 [Glycine max]|uniref:Uncharacterized protein n=2 Tax=Glycine subgen. Soja TaxID=1462606 RepID=A0A0R0KPZ0_SOYBN|nr:hypothetical protein JHK85_007585 [Glycine max]KAH1069779.1 hypothetical protein GYH30_007103 [Glycine max]KRH66827.1 hypothetical protein GLYMA_03G131300v4 [Glycine max]RZC20450.1 hypothetical protein D0Y65_007038 [Glycine soja]